MENEFVATVGDLAENGPMNIVMGCSCAGNPADGVAFVDADVSGVMFRSIVDAANPDAGVNTAVFTSADGYGAALPLCYLDQRYSLIVFDVNGQPLSDSMGGSNQLWLSGTSANYFARDITAIRFEERQTPPPAPAPRRLGWPMPTSPTWGSRQARPRRRLVFPPLQATLRAVGRPRNLPLGCGAFLIGMRIA